MGAGSFKADIKATVNDCLTCDDGTVGGAAAAGWATVNIVPPACVWYLFISPAYCFSGDIMPIAVAVLGAMIGLLPTLVTFVAFLVPGILAAGMGAVVGLIRKIKQ